MSTQNGVSAGAVNNTYQGQGSITTTTNLPFKLTVTIHEAKEMKFSYSSVEYSFDPYVYISLNNKMLLRSPTIFKCKNYPIWNHTQTCFLLHDHVTLKVDILDENQNKLDKVLAATSINLWDIPMALPIERTYALFDPDNGNSKNGALKLTLLLEKNGEPAIKIEKKPQKSELLEVSPKVLEDLKTKLKSLQLEGKILFFITSINFN